MKLLETCEPLFQYICRLNRSARKGGHHTLQHVQAEIRHLLREISAKAKTDPELMAHLQTGRVYLALVFFVDFMVANSSLPFADDWPNLAFELKEMAGDAKFFELLDATLADRSESATERIAVFYTCMGLGFTGWLTGQPEQLRRKMLECAARLRGLINADENARVCPDAYNPDTRVLFKPVRSSLLGITVTLVVLLATLFVLNVVAFKSESSSLRENLGKLSGRVEPAGSADKSTAAATAENPRPVR
jgi:type VI secretion system protein ImpK